MYTLGIDLGTTFSAAAVFEAGHAEVVSLGERAPQIPSVVSIKVDGEVLVGEAAERRAITDPTRTAREFKRRLGDPTPLVLGGVPFGVEALEAQLVRAIVQRVNVQRGGPPTAITLTHPANYGGYKVDLLREVVRLANVGPVEFLTEPQAAAIHYATQERVADGEVVAVYDFGGGTFDATVLRRRGDGFELLGQPQGLDRLGGIDFDQAVYAHVTAAVADAIERLDLEDLAHQTAVARLRDECRLAKEALSSDTDVSVPVVLPTITTEVRLTRGEFEDMIRPRVDETVQVLQRVLREAGVNGEDLGRVLLVGGSSRIPLVGELVRRGVDRPVVMDAHPKFAVALGAARHAGLTAPEAAGSAAATSPPGAPSEPAPPAPPAPPASVEPGSAGPVPLPPPSPAPAKRRRGVVAVVAVVAAAGLIGAIIVATRSSGRSSPSAAPSSSAASSEPQPAALSGSTVVFSSDRTGDVQLFTLDVDSGAVSQLTHDPGFNGVAAISPDRRKVAYLHSDEPQNRTGPRTLRIVDSDGSHQRILDVDIAVDGRPAWSPDGGRIAFPSEAGGSQDLSIVDLATGKATALVVDAEKDSDPSWSPDGRTITYTRDLSVSQVFAIPADGSSLSPTLLVDDNGAADADWSADGRSLVYDGQRRANATITIVDADGSNRREVFRPSTGLAVDPFWSPDDRRIVFTTNQDGNNELYVVNPDGSGLRRLTDNAANDDLPAW